MFKSFTRLTKRSIGTLPRCSRRISSDSAKRQSDPLRILFCGSDEFSCASLQALHDEHKKNTRLVESLEVMVLPPKRTGRGFRTIREVPCKILADNLGLKIHQRDTFTKWDIPNATNLIVAVSFGLFVPPRILRAAKYGGMNVHPSLLPDLRGPAPVHHAILRGDQYTGVSLQTLDDKAFDHGLVLSQTPLPGFPIPPKATVQELTKMLAPIGAEMLVQGLRNGVHVPPRPSVGWAGEEPVEGGLKHAPKVTKADGQVDWDTWTGIDFLRRVRALGSVWTRVVNKKGQERRLIMQDAVMPKAENATNTGLTVEFIRTNGTDAIESRVLRHVELLDDGSCIVELCSGNRIQFRRIKEEGKPDREAAMVMRAFVDVD